MDWRLIGAASAAAGSLCFVAIGAYVVLSHNPAPQQAIAPPPILPPSLSAPSPFAPQGNSLPVSPAATSGAAVAPGRLGAAAAASSQGHSEPRREYKTVALTPYDAAPRPEPPPRPVVEVKKSSVVPELHTALPTSRYRGVLTSAEIARVKYSLRMTPDQERAWPSVEAALAEMGRQQMALIRHGQEPRISQNDWPPGRLYAAAGPLLQTLRPDQKETVRRLVRSLGFESVASML